MSIFFFFIIVAVTLVITYFAARKTKTSSEFYAAGRSVSALQNGFALAGDYMSAASFLGISGMVALKGYDGMIYATGWLVGWPALMFLVAEPLRNLGKFTFADVVAFRLRQKPVRIAAAIGGILTVLFYTIAQMVGSGALIQLMFGLKYEYAELIVGVVMLAYVLFGGMLATTWVQIIKAALLLFGVTLSPDPRAREVRLQPRQPLRRGGREVRPGRARAGRDRREPLEAISLGLALMFGLLGLPHILMRFYTVPDAKAARKSVLYATGLIGYFYIIIPIVGFGAAVLTPGSRSFILSIDKGGNMAAPLLAELLGGTAFLGFIAAVAFATILAVVAGLTLAGASAYSHDIYVNVIEREGDGGGAGQGREDRHDRLRRLRGRPRHPLQGPERRVHGRPRLRDRRERELPGAPHVDHLEALHDPGRGLVDLVGALASCSMIVLSKTVWVDVFGFEHAISPSRTRRSSR